MYKTFLIWFFIVYSVQNTNSYRNNSGRVNDTPKLNVVEFPKVAGKSIKTNSTFNGHPVYVLSFSFPGPTEASIPLESKGIVINQMGSLNVSLTNYPRNNFIIGLNSMVESMQSGQDEIVYKATRPDLRHAGLARYFSLVIDQANFRGKDIDAIISTAYVHLWFI